jgi:Mrp family chromosome partitioning ATPase
MDSPPVLGVSDASLLVSKSDATLLVLQPRKMPIKALVRTKMLVENAGGQIMGLVMNNVDINGDTQYQYYTTYYSYYSKDSKRVDSVKPASSRKAGKKQEKSVAVNKDEDLY